MYETLTHISLLVKRRKFVSSALSLVPTDHKQRGQPHTFLFGGLRKSTSENSETQIIRNADRQKCTNMITEYSNERTNRNVRITVNCNRLCPYISTAVCITVTLWHQTGGNGTGTVMSYLCTGKHTWLHSFLTSALEGEERANSRSGRFIPGKRAPDTHWIGC
jgi:hypothetical protein